jgi:regulator of protease activity HflC (stomatin/prohibitin superfamily)
MLLFSFVYILAAINLIAVLLLATASIKILREYERAVVFTLGRFQKSKGLGLVLLIPFIGNGAGALAHSSHRDSVAGRNFPR